MPLYEYRCRDCLDVFVRLQAVDASADDVQCPHCESNDVERLLSTIAGIGSTAASSSSSGGAGFT